MMMNESKEQRMKRELKKKGMGNSRELGVGSGRDRVGEMDDK